MGLISQFTFFAMMLFTFTSALAVAANEKQFSYFVRVPAGSRSCAAEAAALASRFKQSTQLENVSANCQSVNKIIDDKKEFQLFSIAVTYSAKNHVLLYSAKLSDVDTYGDSSGVEGLFDKYEDCLRAIPTQVANYEKGTELNALVSLCERGAYPQSSKYVLRIDGIGKPKRVLRGFKPSATYVYSDEFIEKIRNMFLSSGKELVLEKEQSFFYYAEWRLDIKQFSLGYFSNPELCRRQLGEANTILGSAGGKLHEATCLAFSGFGDGSGDNGELEPLTLAVFQVGGKYISESQINKYTQYYSFEECTGDKPRVYNEYRNTKGIDPLGAICKDSGDRFVMTVFEN